MANIQSNECMSIINNKYLNKKRIGAGINLLQSIIIPTLTYGAETWNKLTKKEIDDINGVQTNYLAKLLNVPVTTPKFSLIAPFIFKVTGIKLSSEYPIINAE